MAKTQNKVAKVETAFGEQLATAIQFPYNYEELEKGDAIPTDEQPDAADILQLVNSKRNASARSSAQAKAFAAAGIEKPTLENPEVRLKNMVKILVAAGNDTATAEQIAKSALGM